MAGWIGVGSPCPLEADAGGMAVAKRDRPRNPPMMMWSLPVEGKPSDVAGRLAELEALVQESM